MRKIITTTSIIILLLVGLILVLSNNKAKNEAQASIVASDKDFFIPVRIATASIQELSAEYSVNGIFKPNREVLISTEIPGVVVEALAKEGQYVSKGQTLAVIKGDLQAVSLSNAQTVYNDALAEVERFESAYETGGVTKQQLDKIKLQLENAKNNLRSAQLNAGNTKVKASFDGIVNQRNIEPGSYVNPGQILFEIVDIKTLKLRVNIDEKNIGNVKVNQKVEIKSSVLPELKWEGVVSFIAPKADASLNFPVELEIQNKENTELKAGMYGTAYFGKDELVKTLVVPREAFVGNVSSKSIFINENNSAKLKTVNVGRDFGDFIEILSGIEEGNQVITSGQINLFDGTSIEILH